MAVVSEGTLYQAKIAPSYVSSSGYYGYVPPCPIADYENVIVHPEQQLGRVGRTEANDQTAAKIAATTTRHDWILSSTMLPSSMHQPHLHQDQQNHLNHQQLICFNGSAMETDDDDNCRREYLGVSRCQNNRCVIPEAAGRLSGGAAAATGGYGYYCDNVYRVTEQEANARRRGNRKRNNAGDPAYLFAGQPANLTKKSRQDGGNGNVRDGSGSPRKRRSSTLHYEQASLNNRDGNVGIRPNERCKPTFAKLNRCRETAGNYHSIGDSDMERPCKITSNAKTIDGDSYLDYEIMLMETHGCSAYHYHQRPYNLDVGVLEAEF